MLLDRAREYPCKLWRWPKINLSANDWWTVQMGFWWADTKLYSATEGWLVGGRLEYGGMREIRIEAFSQWLDAASANNQKGLLPDIKLSFLMSYHEPSSIPSSASYSVMWVGVFSANCNYDGDKRGLIKTRNCYLANIHPGFWWSCVIPSPPKMPVLSRRGFSTIIIRDWSISL